MGHSCSVTAPEDPPLIQGLPLEPQASSSSSVEAPAKKASEQSAVFDKLPLSSSRFAISRRRAHGWNDGYIDRSKIGQGVSANVFVAEAGRGVATSGSRARWASMEPSNLCSSGCFGEAAIRRVAIKRFRKVGAECFALELDAHSQVGAHPNVLRLLESMHNGEGEDVLVFEYCDGLTVWSAFRAEQKNNALLHRLLVARMMRQVLLALEHINAHGIEHQDVKPENMMLYDFSLEEQRASVKLGDFGWATRGPWTSTRKLPRQGVGSLWYAAPEMNPPVAHLGATRSTRDSEGDVGEADATDDPIPVGRSDMWSAGVVVYMLMVGHNPFADASRKQNEKEVEAEVMVLVADGRFDSQSTQWAALAPNLQAYISASLHVQPSRRPSAQDALRHTDIFVSVARSADNEPLALEGHIADREDAWAQLDGFQRLAWISVARAVGEPEVRREVVVAAFRAIRKIPQAKRHVDGGTDDTYVIEMAKIISHMQTEEAWLREPVALTELLRLAFNFLDVDGDGMLTSADLCLHAATDSEGSQNAVASWLERWKDSRSGGKSALTHTSFRNALGLQCLVPQAVYSPEHPWCGREGIAYACQRGSASAAMYDVA